MKTLIKTIAFVLIFKVTTGVAQNSIPIDTINWNITTKNYVLETFKGKKSIYLKSGGMKLKDRKFLNGTIEFNMYLSESRGFPGIYFRLRDDKNGEQWYLRPHQSGNPDANQAAPILNGKTPWQLNFGKRYSFPYKYKYNDWTHVKLVVKDDKAQIFLDHAKTPNLSWHLFTEAKAGDIIIRGGGVRGIHIANIKVDDTEPNLVDFKPVFRKPIKGLIEKWKVSSTFNETILKDISQIRSQIDKSEWIGEIEVEEGTAANISRKVEIKKRKENTVFTKIEIISDIDQQKLFHFGYSDRVVALLNGNPIYKGNNGFRTRDYRYLGTIGLFDAIYLNLKKGKNTLLMAVSEDFGGWLITGKFENTTGIKIKY
ncbi:hypothetical protein [Seonamhaeicola marinus]|uniref:DUF1080 domain-containing protein n=1 Tax=Seonamhaeicola marinus TaxID=1912246 RepID=A0A5D0HNJ7_9FLAO|nr:hypothetical protein [Seonamhaeicola marinus]TYA71959.1 hypothetical protein FUA24_20640 [Seonamhaeicola marinus]